MPEEFTASANPEDEGLAAEVASQPEDEDPLALAGEESDAPVDSGRPEGVGP